jgi:hypothetical protein
VAAENAGAAPLIANRTAIGPWETFQLIRNTDGSVSLRALANGRFVTAENAGAAPLIANRTAIGTWERFDLSASPGFDAVVAFQRVVRVAGLMWLSAVTVP